MLNIKGMLLALRAYAVPLFKASVALAVILAVLALRWGLWIQGYMQR